MFNKYSSENIINSIKTYTFDNKSIKDLSHSYIVCRSVLNRINKNSKEYIDLIKFQNKIEKELKKLSKKEKYDRQIKGETRSI